MELIELKKELEEVNKQISEFKTSLKIEEKEQRVAEIENMMLDADFWNDSETASTLVTESKSIKKELDEFSAMLDYLNHSEEMIEFLNDEDDEEIYQELIETVRDLKQQVEDFSFRLLFAEEYDNNTAILEIHAGAGGTDATDWAEIMLRMYERFFTKQGLSYSYLNYQSGDITGVKSATLKIEGDFAYGLLKGEKGVHRVVRISPFDPSGKRHTSFAAVFVYPEVDNSINIEINKSDVREDTFRASGAGGQHINKTDSAIRLTHIPTGIVVTCQSERSQHSNRATAWDQLKSKLYQLELQKQNEVKSEIENSKLENGWGSQIRSYVLDDSRVKDLRTGYESKNPSAVLDGDLDKFVIEMLHKGN